MTHLRVLMLAVFTLTSLAFPALAENQGFSAGHGWGVTNQPNSAERHALDSKSTDTVAAARMGVIPGTSMSNSSDGCSITNYFSDGNSDVSVETGCENSGDVTNDGTNIIGNNGSGGSLTTDIGSFSQ